MLAYIACMGHFRRWCRNMSNEELVSLIQGGEDVTDNMVVLWQQNQGYIIKVARKYQHLAEVEDLMQEAYIGLTKAVENYRLEEGTTFISYATYWIKQAIHSYIENCGLLIRLPPHMANMVTRYKIFTKEYENRYGVVPTDEQMSHLLDISDKRLQTIQKALNTEQISSLNIPIGNDGEGQIMDLQASAEDLEEDVVKCLDRADMKRALWSTIDLLGERNKKVLRLRYQEGKTLKEVGNEVGVTLSYVRAIENECMKKLRLKKDGNMVFRRYFEDYIAPSHFSHVTLQGFKHSWTSQTEREVMKKM